MTPNWCMVMSASDRRRLNLCFVGWGAIARRVGELLSERHPHGVNIVAVAVRTTIVNVRICRPRFG